MKSLEELYDIAESILREKKIAEQQLDFERVKELEDELQSKWWSSQELQDAKRKSLNKSC